MLKRFIQLFLTPLPSRLKVPIYRMLGARIDKRARIAPFVVLVADSITLGPCARIRPLTLINGCESLTMGAYASISNLCVINGPASLTLKPRAFVGPGCMVDLHAPVTVGEYSGVGPRCTLMTHSTFWPSTWGCTCKVAPIVIGDMVWLGFGCHLGAGVNICDRVAILPNTTVLRDVRKTGMVHDNGLTRKTFPFAPVQHRISGQWLREHVRELVGAYYRDCLQKKGYEILEETGRFVLRRNAKQIIIHVEAIGESPDTTASHWLLGFDVSERILSETTNIEVLDMLQLLHSSRPTKDLRYMLDYFRSTWGLRFADARDRHHFSLHPPLPENTE